MGTMPRSASAQELLDGMQELNPKPQPFVKWAGGKRSILPEILKRFPKEYGTYFEPFVGAGAVLFSQDPKRSKVVGDYNSELISVYKSLRDNVDEVIRELKKFKNTKKDFLEIRAWDRSPQFPRRTPASRAARFIYLNKCGFNGLYRVNRQGLFNVPYGSNFGIDFVNEDNLRSVSQFLNERVTGKRTLNLVTGDYRKTLSTAAAGDLVYCDPPYDPISTTSNFTSYSDVGFSRSNQLELRDEVLRLTSKGVYVLLSNSSTEFIQDIYGDSSVFKLEKIQVRRAISASSDGRGSVQEVLITNFPGLK